MIFAFLPSCLKEVSEELSPIPFFTVTTDQPDDSILGQVRFSGQLDNLGGGTVDRHGFVWSDQIQEPTLDSAGAFVIDLGAISGDASFDTLLENIKIKPPLYFVRSFAQQTRKGQTRTVYGQTRVFSFREFVVGVPQVVSIFNDTVIVRSILFGLQGQSGTVEQRGHVYDVASNPAPSLGQGDSTELGPTNDDGFFFDTLVVGFNEDLRVRSYVKFAGEELYSEESLLVKTAGGWKYRGIKFPRGVIGPVAASLGGNLYAGMACDLNTGCDIRVEALDRFWLVPLSAPGGDWDQSFNFPGDTLLLNGISFALETQGKIYYGIGENIDNGQVQYFRHFWSFDPTIAGNAAWERLPDFPGTPRSGAVAFTLNGKAYIGSGFNQNEDFGADQYLSDFWEFDPANSANPWRQVDSLPRQTDANSSPGLRGRSEAVAFTVEGRAFVGLGTSSFGSILSDCWEFNPADGSWTLHSFFPAARYDATALSIADKGAIVGLGYDNVDYFSDWFRFAPDSDPAWSRITDRERFPGPPQRSAFGIALEGVAYVGGGRQGTDAQNQYQEIWEYIPPRQP